MASRQKIHKIKKHRRPSHKWARIEFVNQIPFRYDLHSNDNQQLRLSLFRLSVHELCCVLDLQSVCASFVCYFILFIREAVSAAKIECMPRISFSFYLFILFVLVNDQICFHANYGQICSHFVCASKTCSLFSFSEDRFVEFVDKLSQW